MAIVLTYGAIGLRYPLQVPLDPAKNKFLGGRVFIVLFALVAGPVIGITQSIMGAIINGFAFYEAWKLNIRASFHVVGPLNAPLPARLTPDPVPEVSPGG